MVEQVKYELQNMYDSYGLFRKSLEVQINEIHSSFHQVLKGIIAGIGFIIPLLIGIASTNTIKFPLIQALAAGFTVGAILYMFFLFYDVKIYGKLRAIYPSLSVIPLALSYIKGSIVKMALYIERVSPEEIVLFEAYMRLVSSGSFALGNTCGQLKKSPYLKSRLYQNFLDSWLEASDLAIKTGSKIYNSNREQILKSDRIKEIDLEINTLIRSLLPQFKNNQSFLKKYEDIFLKKDDVAINTSSTKIE